MSEPVLALQSHRYRDYDTFDLECPCGRRLAKVTQFRQTVAFAWSEPTGDDDWPTKTHHEQDEVVIGYRADLEPGLVNARGRHPARGWPWYRQGRRDRQPPVLQVRLPAIVTCNCGLEVALDPDWERKASRYGRLSPDGIADDLADEREFEAKLDRDAH